MGNFYIKKQGLIFTHFVSMKRSLDQIKLANTQTVAEYRKLHLLFIITYYYKLLKTCYFYKCISYASYMQRFISIIIYV